MLFKFDLFQMIKKKQYKFLCFIKHKLQQTMQLMDIIFLSQFLF